MPTDRQRREPSSSSEPPATVRVKLRVNGRDHDLEVDVRATLLDVLRERLDLTGTKKGCDRGECGACTIHINGRRVLSCMSLAVMQTGKKEITTIEGLSSPFSASRFHENEDTIISIMRHPVQESFIEHDAFQCGYCTPGQIMSAVACIGEGHAKSPSEVREWMSGNICRCGAYSNIVEAVLAAAAAIANGGRQRKRRRSRPQEGGREIRLAQLAIHRGLDWGQDALTSLLSTIRLTIYLLTVIGLPIALQGLHPEGLLATHSHPSFSSLSYVPLPL
jgi:xanthine dehydrogenase YagT iron-sulfur-binding subunit